MDRYYACIKNNTVSTVIVAKSSFIDGVRHEYDIIIDVTDISRPAVGDSFYPDTNIFVSNNDSLINIPLDSIISTGTEIGFEPFNISKYSVKYADGLVIIGCKKYPAKGLLAALHKYLIEDREGSVSCFTESEEGPAHGKFGITWEDAQMLYDALIKVQL